VTNVVAVALAVALAACGKDAAAPTKPTAAAKCTRDGDCVISCESKGNCCSAPCCATAGLASEAAEVAAYNREHCKPGDCTDVVGACDTTEVVTPRCQAGTCVAEKTSANSQIVDMTQFDRSCAAASDCAVVNAHPCFECECAQEPIAAKDVPKFRAAAAAVRCQRKKNDLVSCEPCTPARVDCVAGTCQRKP
jgi:hypothetical protein